MVLKHRRALSTEDGLELFSHHQGGCGPVSDIHKAKTRRQILGIYHGEVSIISVTADLLQYCSPGHMEPCQHYMGL